MPSQRATTAAMKSSVASARSKKILGGDAARVITIADDNAAEHGVRFTGADPADRAPESLPALAALLASGRLTVPVWRTYPLAEAARAHADLDAGRNHGKLILLP